MVEDGKNAIERRQATQNARNYARNCNSSVQSDLTRASASDRLRELVCRHDLQIIDASQRLGDHFYLRFALLMKFRIHTLQMEQWSQFLGSYYFRPHREQESLAVASVVSYHITSPATAAQKKQL